MLLLDVSRSMSAYSFFYLRLARALCAELADVHCFIFHTRITGIAEALRDPDPWRSQERLHLLAAGWAGGTRIGECLQAFNGSTPRARAFAHAVIIVSDGYDTGEPEALATELGTLRRRARRLVWLNPLLRGPGFHAGGTRDAGGAAVSRPFRAGADLADIEHILPDLVSTLAMTNEELLDLARRSTSGASRMRS